MESINIGLLSAMPEEIGTAIDNLENVTLSEYGDLKIYYGKLKKKIPNYKSVYVTLAWSGWGKVSSARAITRILSGINKVDLILFTGVAGAANKNLNQWDIVIADEVMQHDMDARPIFDKFVLPSLKKAKIKCNNYLIDWIFNSLTNRLNNGSLKKFGVIRKGLIATGDSFISDESVIKRLKDQIPNLEAIEMEGAAVAQVAEQERIPWAIIRVISDSANSNSMIDFDQFLKDYVFYSWELLDCILEDIPKILV
ncbi:5'-methylthioadenosine/adenosylhomocysteine nucleosidase [Prochlorococcus marinus XMU1411]|uniref:5'-methylthioadenosine/adenosylhomocysteine nucleosidase n=1 Tax=Prochlorococcus marinus TaxID=1219 RepID=UPI001AD9CDF2|nr:5'-methylthioadenosine/adenosylhomocysteine nucleosidase [Prochlorococcus marinus]MBO8244230.1 5'-methylthioadenosine/adenosylhomocysteine nucleosidase [Prochlorococcus marinus XMU1411]MBW3055316.1 5'-methylthioadenosine/adenosylhomocysteine nucleosidase [Prochlorococcus marinus str. MU1411]MCR8537058.1 5'-methylthioadenosine/adenosylhomocysteine nucleosidase [Prochlorococcus marinus CUG1430]